MRGSVDYIALQARLYPDHLAAINLVSDQRWSFAQLDRDVGACARVLRGLSLAEGARVAAVAKNHVLLLILHAACARLGLIFTPLNWRLSRDELAVILADADPALLVQDDAEERGLPTMALSALGAAIVANEPLTTRPYDHDRPSLILFSSGTTGRPKGVVLTENNLIETAINAGVMARIDSSSRVLNESPHFHVMGLISNVRPYWMQGGAVLVSDVFEPGRTIARFADPGLAITHYFCVPTMAALIRQHPDFSVDKLSGLLGVFSGGAPSAPDVVRRWLADGIPLVNGYGMTETGFMTGMPADIARIDARPASVGLNTPRMELRIADEQDRPLPHGRFGEVQVRGPNVASGYWRRPEEAAKSFSADGWLRTGDIGFVDAEGFLTLVDRKKDMYISGGENVYPAEIEAEVIGFEGVTECAVIGVEHAKWGEVGVLFVVGDVDLGALQARLAARLARYKLPHAVTVLNALPRNGVGKVDKIALRSLPGATM